MSEELGQAAFNHAFWRFFKTVLYLGAAGCLCFMIFMVLALAKISSTAFDTYQSYRDVPYHRVGLLLGTSSNVAPGQPNDFFTHRIMAAATLFKRGKIDYILVSGDNRHPSYNEPRQMMRALIKAGVPADKIVADYAGFSTIDSIVRAKKVFMLNDFTVISQSFHNERALFIAKHNGIDAAAFNASAPSSFFANFKVEVREFFARIKCVFDVYFLNSQPKFLGEPIAIGDAPLPKNITSKPRPLTSKPKYIGLSVQGLKAQQDEIESIRAIAKDPGDNAIIIKQKQAAREAMLDLIDQHQ